MSTGGSGRVGRRSFGGGATEAHGRTGGRFENRRGILNAVAGGGFGTWDAVVMEDEWV
jgi:hypothetical protein